MATSKYDAITRLKWKGRNKIEEGVRIYRADATFASDALPSVYEELPRDSSLFIDRDFTEKGQGKYYRVESYTPTLSKVSDITYLESIPDMHIYSGGGVMSKIAPDKSVVWSFIEHISSVNSVAVDSDGYVYSGGGNKTPYKIDPDGNQVWSFTGHTSSVYSVAVDSDGYVYSGSQDKTVKKIDPEGNQVWSFEGHTNNINSVAVDSDGYVYSGSWDKTVKKIDPEGVEVWSFEGHTKTVNSVAVDSDGYVYSGSADNTLKKIDPEGNEVWSFDNGNTVNGIAVDLAPTVIP